MEKQNIAFVLATFISGSLFWGFANSSFYAKDKCIATTVQENKWETCKRDHEVKVMNIGKQLSELPKKKNSNGKADEMYSKKTDKLEQNKVGLKNESGIH